MSVFCSITMPSRKAIVFFIEYLFLIKIKISMRKKHFEALITALLPFVTIEPNYDFIITINN